jgi:threonine dehydratase
LSWGANATPAAELVPIEEIGSARERIAGSALRTPLVRLNIDNAPADFYLKLENLQPIGSFKIRGAANVMAQADPGQLSRGVYTASAGNMAQGVAWNARRLDVPCTAVVPETAPEGKLAAIRRLGADYVKVPFDEWWKVMVDHRYEPLADRVFVHPFRDPRVMAGNGTIGLEILEDLPDVDAVIVPYGGGGLSCGIASALHPVRREAKVYASEVETAAPLAASFEAGRPMEVPYTPSFVDGIGAKALLEEMWPLARFLLAGSLVVSLGQTSAAIRLLAERNRVIAEGAAATSVAAALTGRAGTGKVVCVISGGNIDSAKLARILTGQQP